MKVLVQWTVDAPGDYEALDSSEWALRTGFPAALNVQGVVFSGYDHYAVEDLPDGCRITVWKDTPPLYARAVTFHPLAPDPRFGGAWNTRQSQVVYAGPEISDHYANVGPVENMEVRPWSEFVPPSSHITRPGRLVPDALWAAHEGVRTTRGWREWTDGVPDDQIDNGRVRMQRPQGRYRKPVGTKTFFQRDTDLANGIHAATHEDAFNATAGAGETESVTFTGGVQIICWTWVTPSTEPNSAAWPTGNYRCQLDVNTAGADISYGLRNAGAATGHFARVNSGITSDLETKAQSEAQFSGAGLKLATTGSVSWTAGDATDRFECVVAGTRLASHGNQTLSLTFDADAFADGPWIAEIIKTVADSGSGSEAAGVSVQVPVSDSGAGAETTPGIQAQVPVGDAGAGIEDVLIVVPVLVADDGTGQDVVEPVDIVVPVQDDGVGTDAPTVAAALFVPENGVGSEDVSAFQQFTVADAGAGTELARADAVVPVTDAGVGVDAVSVPEVSLIITETGVGTDAVAIALEAMLADAGIGSEVVSVGASLVLADSGAGADAISVPQVALVVVESGAGTEALAIAAEMAVVDSGIGADEVSVGAVLSLADSGVGVDALLVEAVIPVGDTGSGTDDVLVVQGGIAVSVADAGAGSETVTVTPQGVTVINIRARSRIRAVVTPNIRDESG